MNQLFSQTSGQSKQLQYLCIQYYYKQVYIMIEALSDGAVKMGLPRSMALQFSAQTVFGAAKMVLQTKRHPAQLKDEVCSAGGSTITGVHAMECGGVR